MSRTRVSRSLVGEIVDQLADQSSGKVVRPTQVDAYMATFAQWDADDLVAAVDTYTSRSSGQLWRDFPPPAAIAVFKPGRANDVADEEARRADCYCDRDGYLRYLLIDKVARPERGRVRGVGWLDTEAPVTAVVPCSRCNPTAYRVWRMDVGETDVWTGDAPWWEGPEWRTKVAGVDTNVLAPGQRQATPADIGAMP